MFGEKRGDGPGAQEEPKQVSDQNNQDEVELGFEKVYDADTETDASAQQYQFSVPPPAPKSFHSYETDSLVSGEYERDEQYWDSVKEAIMSGLFQNIYKKSKAEVGLEKLDFKEEQWVEMAIYRLNVFKDIERYYGGDERPNNEEDYYIGVAPYIKEVVLDDITIKNEPVKVVVEVAYGKKHLDIFCKNLRIEK